MSDIDDLATVEAMVAELAQLRPSVECDQADMKETLRAIEQRLSQLESAVTVTGRGQDRILALLTELIERGA